MPGPIIQFSTLSSQPIPVGDLKITVRSRALQVRFPGASGGVIWNRPVLVSVHQPDGAVEHLPVRDVTRWVQVAFVAGALLAFVILRPRKRARRDDSSGENHL